MAILPWLESLCWKVIIDKAVHDVVHHEYLFDFPSGLQFIQGKRHLVSSWKIRLAALLCTVSMSDLRFCPYHIYVL